MYLLQDIENQLQEDILHHDILHHVLPYQLTLKFQLKWKVKHLLFTQKIYFKLSQHCSAIWTIYILTFKKYQFFILIIFFHILIISFCILVNCLICSSSNAFFKNIWVPVNNCNFTSALCKASCHVNPGAKKRLCRIQIIHF